MMGIEEIRPEKKGEMMEAFFDDHVQTWSRKCTLSGIISAAKAEELVNSGKYEIINKGAIDEVYF